MPQKDHGKEDSATDIQGDEKKEGEIKQEVESVMDQFVGAFIFDGTEKGKVAKVEKQGDADFFFTVKWGDDVVSEVPSKEIGKLLAAGGSDSKVVEENLERLKTVSISAPQKRKLRRSVQSRNFPSAPAPPNWFQEGSGSGVRAASKRR